jgi:hypothetical protein
LGKLAFGFEDFFTVEANLILARSSCWLLQKILEILGGGFEIGILVNREDQMLVLGLVLGLGLGLEK